MSEININVGGSMSGVTIDTETMRDRLETIREQLQRSIDRGIGDPEQLQDRINKVDSQLARLDQYAGQDVEISSARAAMELQRGLKQIGDGLDFVNRQAEGFDHATTMEQRLESWQGKLLNHQGRLDTWG